jgi:hypothetical protein
VEEVAVVGRAPVLEQVLQRLILVTTKAQLSSHSELQLEQQRVDLKQVAMLLALP